MDKVPTDLPAQAVSGFAHVNTGNFILVVVAATIICGILGALTAGSSDRSQKAIICAFGGAVVSIVLFVVYSIYFTGTITPVQ